MCIYGVQRAVCVIGNVGGNQSNKGFKQGNFLTAKPEQDTTKLFIRENNSERPVDALAENGNLLTH